jgi:hypothetical protein
MSGITMGRKIYNQIQLEGEYGFTKSQQVYFRTQLKMPYCKVGKLYFYNGREIDNWILSFKVTSAKEANNE